MKKNKKIIIIILAIIVALIIGFFIVNALIENPIIDFKNKEQETKNYPKNQINENGEDCTEKGKLCTIEQIGKGILYEVKVNSKNTKNFYMVSNTEDKMVFVSEESFYDIAYSNDEYNFFGPRNLVEQVYNATKDWNLVEPLKYEYEDQGKEHYYSLCNTPDDEVENYNCRLGVNGMGFKYIKYDDGITYEDGFGNVITVGKGDIYARPVTLEDINNLFQYNGKISWIEKSEAFWLMDSDSQDVSGIIMSAKYVLPNKDSSYGFYVNPDNVGTAHKFKVAIEISKK